MCNPLNLQYTFLTMILMASITALAETNECQTAENAFLCVHYIKNYDGDTATFDIPGVHPLLGDNIAVRFAGIDTPEIKSKDPCERNLAKSARDYVERLLTHAKRIDLTDVKRGKYFRIVGRIVADGVDLSHQLLVKGFAVPYDGGTKKKNDWCRMRGEVP